MYVGQLQSPPPLVELLASGSSAAARETRQNETGCSAPEGGKLRWTVYETVAEEKRRLVRGGVVVCFCNRCCCCCCSSSSVLPSIYLIIIVVTFTSATDHATSALIVSHHYGNPPMAFHPPPPPSILPTPRPPYPHHLPPSSTHLMLLPMLPLHRHLCRHYPNILQKKFLLIFWREMKGGCRKRGKHWMMT